MKALVVVFFYFLMEADETRKYSKCELYEELTKHGLDGYTGIGVGHWICLILFGSGYDTEYYKFSDGHPYYGLFHLSGLKWCSNGRHPSENLCKIDCDNFLDDNISDDVECAKKVAASKGGMMSWKHFGEYCTHPMPEIVFWECKTE
ncbi:lysozyme C, milk isozyme [Pogona vitticeps]|uniref:lysozyme n=1 Tax=Pogona vitticeps TaxID=103695 RepID=A0A6J0U4M4_9SAUR